MVVGVQHTGRNPKHFSNSCCKITTTKLFSGRKATPGKPTSTLSLLLLSILIDWLIDCCCDWVKNSFVAISNKNNMSSFDESTPSAAPDLCSTASSMSSVSSFGSASTIGSYNSGFNAKIAEFHNGTFTQRLLQQSFVVSAQQAPHSQSLFASLLLELCPIITYITLWCRVAAHTQWL